MMRGVIINETWAKHVVYGILKTIRMSAMSSAYCDILGVGA